MRTGTAYLLVLVLTVELALIECFLAGARPLGHPFPLAATIAAVCNPLLGYAGGRLLRRAAGAVVPGLVWFAIVAVMGAQRAEGDVVVPATGRGWLLIAVGTVAAVMGGMLGATPRATTSR